MNIKKLALLVALCGGAALAGCGGGGGGSTPGVTPPIGGATPTPATNIPGPSSINTYTSYTVYSGTANGQTYLEVMPLGVTPGTLSGAVAVPGAIIQYPDGSAQIADTLGNFDAAQSAWATANINAVLSNPGLEPEVIAFQPGSSISPADAYVQVYSTQTNTTTASHMRQVLAGGTSSPQDFAGVAVFPRGYAMFDTESRVYHASGVDSNGTYVGLGGATVTWSLALPQGCAGSPAGRLSAVTGDVSRELYTPPSAGSFPAGCQDVVMASVTVNASNYSGSGNAFYYDPSSAVTLQGQLTDSTSKAVAGGIVDLYGGGREFYHGKLFAIADASGNFKRLVPSNRTLFPFAGNPTTAGGKTTYAFFTVNPATIPVGGGGSTTTQNLQETALASVNPFKPLPPVERFIRDGWFIGDLAQEQFPFGEAQSGGTFLTGSLENILQNPTAGATGTINRGAFANWTYTWDSTGKIVVFQQPATQEGGRHAIQMTLAGSTMQYAVNASTACPANNTCYNFIQYYNPAGLSPLSSPIGTPPAGTILAQDGSLAQDVVNGSVAPSGSNFTVGFTRNVYSVGHQTAGSPLYVHGINYSEVPCSVTSTVADTWADASGKSLAAINVS
ncbi:MAG: hypothetical protein M3N19_05795, partial [Candidatus Eremiobacteraeota bacterium]|nr:hypothetical protein [Candidatus Eremiobacteraeota bacterium]